MDRINKVGSSSYKVYDQSQHAELPVRRDVIICVRRIGYVMSGRLPLVGGRCNGAQAKSLDQHWNARDVHLQTITLR